MVVEGVNDRPSNGTHRDASGNRRDGHIQEPANRRRIGWCTVKPKPQRVGEIAGPPD